MKKTQTTTTQHDDIEKALEVLRAAGLLHFREDSQEGIHKFTAIGAALAYVEQGAASVARLAHEYWEEHNHHDLAALLRWMFPKQLNPSRVTYFTDAEYIKQLIDRKEIVLLDDDGRAKSYTVTLTIEETHVDIIASGYNWFCPHCDHMNHEIEALNDVECTACRTHFSIHPPEHAYE